MNCLPDPFFVVKFSTFVFPLFMVAEPFLFYLHEISITGIGKLSVCCFVKVASANEIFGTQKGRLLILFCVQNASRKIGGNICFL